VLERLRRDAHAPEVPVKGVRPLAGG
jgi:hypothetical protein